MMNRFSDAFRTFVRSLFFTVVLLPGFAWAQTPYVLSAAGFDADADVSWPVIIAQEKGFLPREGIQLNSVRTEKAVMGLISGSFDVINAELSTSILANEKGANIVVVHMMCEYPSQHMVLGKSLTQLNELEGKSVGVFQIPSIVQILIKRQLQKNGIDISKINFVRNGGSRDRFASLLAGQSSATTLSTTYAFRAQKEGLKIVTSPADWEKIPWSAVAFRKSWAESNPTIVVKYLTAVLRATKWLYDPNNFDDAVRTLFPLARLDEGTMRWSLKNSLDNKLFNLNRPNVESANLLANIYFAEAFALKAANLASTIQPKYYDQAARSM